MKKLKLIANTLAGASVLAATACGPGEQAISPSINYQAADLQDLPDARVSDATNRCEVDMRYIIDPVTGKISDITDPRLYSNKKDAAYHNFCPPDTVFPPHSSIVYYPAADRKAYHAFQAKATEHLDRATWPRNAGDELFTFPAIPRAVVAIGRVVMDEDETALRAQLFNGANDTPSAATECVILPSMHGAGGSFADSNRTLGNVMYPGETNVPYTLVQLGADVRFISPPDDPPLLNAYCEPGAIVAVRAETPISS